MKKVIAIILAQLLLMLPLCLVSCRGEKKMRIGVSQCSSDDWRIKMNEEILRENLLSGEQVEIEIRSADDSSDKQIADLQYFMDNGFDLIAVAPNEADALTPIVKKIYESDIPVIVFDRTINGDTYTAFQGAKNETLGEQAAKLIYSRAGSNAKIIEIKGLMSSTPARLRHEGFSAACDSLGLSVIASADARWRYEDAMSIADSLLNIYNDDINVVFAHNDRMAIGVADILSRRGIRDKVLVVGIDAAPQIGIKAVSEGKIDASFMYPTEGQHLLRTALAILNDKPYDRVTLFPTPSAVDSSNADILMLQSQALANETAKITELKNSIDDYWREHSIQTALLYGSLLAVALLVIVIFLLVRAYWSHKKHQAEMEARNRELQSQRDELDDLYHKLEVATRSKLNFFTNVSHDLRTPLTLIVDPIQQIAEADNLTPQQRQLAQLAVKNARRLLRLVNQILDIRKFDNGHLALSLINVDLAAAVREWMAPFANVAAGRHIRFAYEIENGDYSTAIDVDKIERVLFNLMSNAFKFTPANGEVHVSMRREADNIIIKVADTGIGIKPEEINQIFDRFFHNNSSINPHGSGIGLALANTFVKMHDGSIEVESTHGQGTTFTVSIPVKKTETESPERTNITSMNVAAEELANIEEEETEIRDDAPTLLVIDDNPDIASLVKSIMEADFSVIRATSGMQGIRMASKYIPDLVICDVMMPGMDGYETCRRIKDEVVTSHIPVLMLTACAQEQQRTAGYNCGADGYMTKPFDSAMLKARCRALIENRKRVLGSSATDVGKGKDHISQLPKNDIDDGFYNRFMQVIESSLGDADVSVEDIASKLGLSRVQMYRKIKALTNFSPAEILRNARMERAARLLKTTERTVSEIAYEVGFSNPGYFAKCYREYFKESPSETQSRTSKMH